MMGVMRFLLPLAGLLGLLPIQDVCAADPPPSLTHHRCYICHSDHEALVGPAFADVAAAWRGRKDAVDQIASDIRAGMRTGGPWHMPPHPEISPSEARAMARYIMSLPPRDAKARPVKQ